MAAAKRKANARAGVEDHDGDAIVRSENIEGLLRSGGDALDVRLHAAADIEEKQDIDGHILAGKVADGEHASIKTQNEIFSDEAGDGASAAIDDLSVDAGEGNIAFEDSGVIGSAENGGCGKKRKRKRAERIQGSP